MEGREKGKKDKGKRKGRKIGMTEKHKRRNNSQTVMQQGRQKLHDLLARFKFVCCLSSVTHTVSKTTKIPQKVSVGSKFYCTGMFATYLKTRKCP